VEYIKDKQRKTRKSLSKRRDQIKQVKEGVDADQKITDVCRKETESYLSNSDVLLAEMQGKEGILVFLLEEVQNLRKEYGQLSHTVARRKGQLDYMNKIIQNRKKTC